MDLDDVLPHVGDWNKYQHIILWLVCLPACSKSSYTFLKSCERIGNLTAYLLETVPCSFFGFNQVFMDRTPDHWCKVPELIEAGWSVERRKNISIPKMVNLCVSTLHVLKVRPCIIIYAFL